MAGHGGDLTLASRFFEIHLREIILAVSRSEIPLGRRAGLMRSDAPLTIINRPLVNRVLRNYYPAASRKMNVLSICYRPLPNSVPPFSALPNDSLVAERDS